MCLVTRPSRVPPKPPPPPRLTREDSLCAAILRKLREAETLLALSASRPARHAKTACALCQHSRELLFMVEMITSAVESTASPAVLQALDA